MKQYGIGYQGSKSAIAEEIIAHLPAGNRLVDLFGGGFAISHCALLSGKWKHILYNDIDPLLPELIRNAISGNYSYERFIPEFISRERFFEKKDTDGYIKICWSFSNDGKTYLFGKDVEPIKKSGHEWVFHNTPIPGFEDIKCDLPCAPQYFSKRRKALNRYAKEQKWKRLELQHLEQLERLQHLERLDQLQQLERLQLYCMDYKEYEYQEGDVVYCDIPYQNCTDGKNNDYNENFDHGAFYQWAISRPYPVYFSSYSLGGIVWEGDKKITLSATNNSLIRREVLYCVYDEFEPPKKHYQGYLFTGLD